MTQSAVPIRRALLSVSDKDRIIDLARALTARGVELLSTGGTKDALASAGLPVTDVSRVTGYPEMLSGRVKTLHPAIHGGLLGLRDDAAHRSAMSEHGIEPIDLLVVNLYPFEETVRKGAAFEACIEQIDIGGPALIRAAAKNHAHVAVVVEPADYAELLSEFEGQDGGTTLDLRRRLAAKAYARTAAYDAAIANWFTDAIGEPAPERLLVSATLRQTLRYGENPHQQAAFYVTGDAGERPGVATARQIQGKELSYNNINDTNAAFELASEFNPDTHAAVAIIKHANPCGVALGDTLVEAYRKALRTDPVSAFGGIVALNRPLNAEAAEEISKIFTEVIIAPDADKDALEILSAKKNLRVLLTGGLADPVSTAPELRQVAGGLLVQGRDGARVDREALRIVTKRPPSETELEDLLFAFSIAKHVKSNAIVYANDLASTGIGAGQMSRLDSARIAARKSQDAADAAGIDAPLTEGSVAASDAFFPFADGLQTIADAGATAVIQPGGSVRDEEVIEAADAAGLAMVFTGIRHFRH